MASTRSLDIGTGIEMGGELAGGAYTGSQLAPFLGSTLGLGGAGVGLGWGLGLGMGAISAYGAYRSRREARKAYKKNRDLINKMHDLSSRQLAVKHSLQERAIRSGQVGTGGGHAVGMGREGSQQRIARTRQAEIAPLEKQVEIDKWQAALAANKAAQRRGGDPGSAATYARQGMQLASFISDAFPSKKPTKWYTPPGGGGEYTGAYKAVARPYSQTAWETPGVW